jgi:hypothetical protein
VSKEKDGKKKRKRMTLEGFAASVELPEGHQLIIGELPAGTVVEVATWQGVGRPDDTTNRFLLTADGPGLQNRRREEIERGPEPVAPAQPIAEAPIPKSAPKEKSEPFLGVTTLEKPELSSVTATPVSPWRNRGRAAFTVAASIAIIVVFLNIIGLSFTVPTVGAKTVFGNTTNSLVIYKRGSALEDNAPTVVITDNAGKKVVVLGAATVYSATQLELSTTKGLLLENANTVAGQSVIAIPFFGWVLGPIFH